MQNLIKLEQVDLREDEPIQLVEVECWPLRTQWAVHIRGDKRGKAIQVCEVHHHGKPPTYRIDGPSDTLLNEEDVEDFGLAIRKVKEAREMLDWEVRECPRCGCPIEP